MAIINDPSVFSRSMSLIFKDSKLLNRLFLEREAKKFLSLPEAKTLIVDELKRLKELNTAVKPSSGFHYNVAQAKLDVISKFLPLLLKYKPEDNAMLEYSIEEAVKRSQHDRSYHEHRMELFYLLRAAVMELSKFSGEQHG